MKINQIIFNWFYSTQGEEYQVFEIGVKNIYYGTPVEIIEHRSAGEGDKWYYDIYFDNGNIHRTFNPNEVRYANS